MGNDRIKRIPILFRLLTQEVGFSLLEILIAVTLIGLTGASFLGAINTGYRTLIMTNRLDQAKQLAQSQMEWVKKQPYNTSYQPSSLTNEYKGFTVTINTETVSGRNPDYFQKITVSVRYDNNLIFQLEGYKIK